MSADHADFTAIKTQGPFQYQVITENCGPNLKHLQPEFLMAQLQIPIGDPSRRELLNHTKIFLSIVIMLFGRSHCSGAEHK